MRFNALILAAMDLTATELAVMHQYIRPEDRLRVEHGPNDHHFSMDSVTRAVVLETYKTIVITSLSSHRLKYCGSSTYDERIAQHSPALKLFSLAVWTAWKGARLILCGCCSTHSAPFFRWSCVG